MAKFNLEDYDTVETRLVRFWLDHPNGRIQTSIYHYDEKFVVIKAEVFFDDWRAMPENREPSVKATGFAEEVRGAGPVNSTSHLENCETSAIGRALANCGYAGNNRPSREEMEKVERGSQVPVGEDMVMQSFPGSTEVPSQPKSAPTMKHPGAPATPKQIGAIQAIIRAKAFNEDEGYSFASATLGRGIESFKNLSMGEASTLIGVLKAIDNPVLPEPAF